MGTSDAHWRVDWALPVRASGMRAIVGHREVTARSGDEGNPVRCRNYNGRPGFVAADKKNITAWL